MTQQQAGSGAPGRQEWEAQVCAVTRAAQVAYPGETERILRGMAIVLDDGVQVDAQGQYWVRSQTHEARHYSVNGHCTCVDAGVRAPEGRCKHRWAKALYRRAAAQGQEAQAEAQRPAARLHYYATWYPRVDSLTGMHGTAIEEGGVHTFVSDDGQVVQPATLRQLVLGGRLDLIQAQGAVDGDLVRKVCGY